MKRNHRVRYLNEKIHLLLQMMMIDLILTKRSKNGSTYLIDSALMNSLSPPVVNSRTLFYLHAYQ
ncbi:hypothetical protein R54876_GBNLAHCA_01484 [Eupransor demetentiae]|uniref:Uncharacterized protein n=1 Tax=Eupransor demetentiae TaxID=3109584 RepID=A0ABP0EUK9_9LACO|nr:hypothetical protein R54876_GBNLAHCA_01484 [Lactobacillaceae bacterium LMG 33000]